MTKRPADALSAVSHSSDADHPWHARGYKPELANSRKAPNEDPKGEVAYQRAFAEAAKQHPPRVPNPAFYPNSQSAQEYIRRRDETIFATKKRSATTSPQSTASTSTLPPPPSAQREDHPPARDMLPQPFRGNNAVAETHVDSRYPPPSALPPVNLRQFPPTSSTSMDDYRSFMNGPPPLTLEPQLSAPAGPDRKLY
jgi:hypothetical protein